MADEENSENSIQLDAVAGHFQRKYENEARESLALAAALRETTQKNANLVIICEQLRQQLMAVQGQEELPLDGEITPPTTKNGKSRPKDVDA